MSAASDGSRPVRVTLRQEELVALDAYARARHWDRATALRAILRGELFGEKPPFLS